MSTPNAPSFTAHQLTAGRGRPDKGARLGVIVQQFTHSRLGQHADLHHDGRGIAVVCVLHTTYSIGVQVAIRHNIYLCITLIFH